MNKSIFRARLGRIFTLERTLCRLFASWAGYVLISLCMSSGYTDLSYGQATPLWLVAVYSCALFLLLSVVAFLTSVHTDSIALFAIAGGDVVFWLTDKSITQNLPVILAVATVYTLITLYCLHANEKLLAKWNPGRNTILIAAIIAGVVCGTVITLHTCMRYLAFVSPNFDFGLFCNMFYNMSETGLPLVTSERDQLLSHFAVHISPVYYLLLPFYWIFPSPLTLQIGQAVVLALGIIPVVLLARHFRLSGKATLLVTVLYACSPAIFRGCCYDLHENCFLPLFLLLTFLFYEKRRYVPMYLSALAVLTVKEDAAVYLFFFALFLLISERKIAHGTALALLSVGYFLLCGYLLETYGTGMMTGRFQNLIYDSEGGLFGAVRTLLVNPGYLLTQLFSTKGGTWDKIAYVLQMLLPLGLLPFCTKRASRWLLIAPILINLLSLYPYQYDIGFQYHFGITAFLVYATVKNLPEMTPATRQTMLAIAAVFCCCLYVATCVPRMTSTVRTYAKGQDEYTQMEEFLDTLPEDASVSTSTFLLPHIADRDEIYEVHYHGDECDVDLVVLDMRNLDYVDHAAHYLAQGYTVHSELEGKIMVLEAPK